MEIDQNSTIPFLDVLLIRTPQKIHTTVYRKKTNTNLYMHRNSFAPNNWKWGTLKTLVRTAYETCSTDEYLRDELKHIRSTFNEINNYPHWVSSTVFKEIKNKQAYQRNISRGNNDEDQKQHLLVLPYKGHKGEQVVNSMRKRLNVVLARNVKIRTCYTRKRLSSCFKFKSRMKFYHEHDLIYHVKCPEESCTNDYIGESGRRDRTCQRP